MMVRAYHEHRGDAPQHRAGAGLGARHHPASAALNDYRVVTIPSGRDGILHPEAVAKVMTPDVAALMVTNPNTLGLSRRTSRKSATSCTRTAVSSTATAPT